MYLSQKDFDFEKKNKQLRWNNQNQPHVQYKATHT